MPGKKSAREKVDWESIKITIVPEGPLNPANPYSSLSPEARLKHLQSLYHRIYSRLIEKSAKISISEL